MCELSDKEVKAFSGLDEAMAEIEKSTTPPICHFTPMFNDSCDFEEWWECKHCGHTKLIATYPAY